MISLLSDHTYTMNLIGATAVGILTGVLGTFAYLRRQSMISDVISHSALPGTLLAFLVMTAIGINGRNMLGLMVGAVIVGGLAVYFTNLIPRISIVRLDAAMAVVLSTFFALGMLLMQYISRNPIPNKGGIQDYLFGNVSTVTIADLQASIAIGLVALVIVALFMKEFSLASFDSSQLRILGFKPSVIDGLMFTTLVVATVIGLKMVGLVLMVAFVITPPTIARQWTNSVLAMTVLSGIVGGLASMAGTYVSIAYGPMPTGPVIVVLLFIVLIASLALSPRRGNAMAEA